MRKRKNIIIQWKTLVKSTFKEMALKEHVSIEFFVETGFRIEFMKESDLVAVLGNLLDNALEAAKQCKERKINAVFSCRTRVCYL